MQTVDLHVSERIGSPFDTCIAILHFSHYMHIMFLHIWETSPVLQKSFRVKSNWKTPHLCSILQIWKTNSIM